MSGRTYYQILGVSRGESARGVRSAFRELARRHHPDRVGPDETPRFQQIVEAYEVLSDPVQRALYDRRLSGTVRSSPPPESIPFSAEPFAAKPPAPAPFAAPPARRSPSTRFPLAPEPLAASPVERLQETIAPVPAVEDLLDRSRRNFMDTWRSMSRSLDALALTIDLSPEEARRGGTLTFGVPVACRCPACHGQARQRLYPCRACGAAGAVEQHYHVSLAIPAGVRDGARYRLPLSGRDMGPINLHVLLRVEPR
jgi:molecular chaperone DnaJ